MKSQRKLYLLTAITTETQTHRRDTVFSLCALRRRQNDAFSCSNSSNSNKILIKFKHWTVSHILHTDVILIAFLMGKMLRMVENALVTRLSLLKYSNICYILKWNWLLLSTKNNNQKNDAFEDTPLSCFVHFPQEKSPRSLSCISIATFLSASFFSAFSLLFPKQNRHHENKCIYDDKKKFDFKCEFLFIYNMISCCFMTNEGSFKTSVQKEWFFPYKKI